MISAHVVALKASMEPADKSIPPAIMTTAAPSATIPRSDVLRRMMTKLDQKFVN
jgi:hypothetical protein